MLYGIEKMFDCFIHSIVCNLFPVIVGIPPVQRSSPKPVITPHIEGEDSKISDDENFVEWDFDPRGNNGNSICLPGLHSSVSQSQCHPHTSFISPPVLSHFSGRSRIHFIRGSI